MFVFNHFFMILLLMEFVMLYLFFFFFYVLTFYSYDFYFAIVFLVLGVCDGILGLSLLVYLVRKTGNDYFLSLSLC